MLLTLHTLLSLEPVTVVALELLFASSSLLGPSAFLRVTHRSGIMLA